MAEKYLPFMVRRSFKNPSRPRPNRFRLKFDRAADGQGHEFSVIYEAPDEKTTALLNRYINAGGTAARPRIRMRNSPDGWEIVEPVDIKG